MKLSTIVALLTMLLVVSLVSARSRGFRSTKPMQSRALSSSSEKKMKRKKKDKEISSETFSMEEETSSPTGPPSQQPSSDEEDPTETANGGIQVGNFEEVDPPLIRCRTDAQGDYGETSENSRTVRFEYEIESHLSGVLLNVELEQLERRISQELLPVLFDDCKRRRRRRLTSGAVGLSEAPQDFFMENKTCQAWTVDMANKCHVVQGQFTVYYSEGAKLEPLDELLGVIQPGVFENKNLARVSLREFDEATVAPAPLKGRDAKDDKDDSSSNWAMYGTFIGAGGTLLLLAFAVVSRQRSGETLLRFDIDYPKEKEHYAERPEQASTACPK